MPASTLVERAAAICRPQPGANTKPVPPGQTATAVSATAAQLQELVVAALGSAYTSDGETPPSQVVWHDHDSEVLVHLDRTQLRLAAGLVLVALTLETDQTGAGQLVVPLAIGTTKQPAGLVVATEDRPRGPIALVDRWGESATAAAWRALLDAAHALALNAGVDTSGARLVPGALSSDGETLSVVPQARHAIDAVVGR